MTHRLQPRPNQTASLDGGCPVLFPFLAHWPAASEPHRLGAYDVFKKYR
jgi:hypothetical protein